MPIDNFEPIERRPTGAATPECPRRVPDWARRSEEDLLRYIYVCPHPSREFDELFLSSHAAAPGRS